MISKKCKYTKFSEKANYHKNKNIEKEQLCDNLYYIIHTEHTELGILFNNQYVLLITFRKRFSCI